MAHRTLPVEISTRTQQSELIQGLITWLELGLMTEAPMSLQLGAREELQQSIDLTVSSGITQPDLLAGLQLWAKSGLLSHSRIDLNLHLPADHPALLTGLDRWLGLKLLTQDQVNRLCHDYLTCAVTILPPVATISAPAAPSPAKVPVSPPVSVFTAPPPTPRIVTWAQHLVQALLAELSVIWLLLLGVFMVIVSSGVLIANQWERFPAAGQYGVLWLYTLAFGASGLWSARKSNLRLTARALRWVTLLLIPLNFIALDVFELWQPLYNLAMLLLAALSLSLLARRCWFSASGGAALEYLLLSYLQWGWARPGIPVIAVYAGIVGITVLTLRRRPAVLETAGEISAGRRPFALPVRTLLLVYGIGLLLGRAIFVAGVALPQLGLALGLSGWLLVWRGTASQASAELTRLTLWGSVGGGLVGLGWLLAFEQAPGQAIGVSVLAMLIFARRLLRTWRRFELVALLAIGLQVFWLAWQQMPPPGQQAATDLYTRLVGPNVHPITALSLTFIPYLIGMVLLSNWLADYRQRDLARFCGWLTLGFGTGLTGLSLLHPALRTLNLVASTLVLGWVVQRQWRHYVHQDRSWRIPWLPVQQMASLTHGGGLLTLIAAIAWGWPRLSLSAWATLLLGVTLAEWGFSFGPVADPDVPMLEHGLRRLLRRSAWPLGLVLGVCAYWLFLTNQFITYSGVVSPVLSEPVWGLLWLAVPLALTGIARTLVSRRQLASQLSLLGLGLLQTLTLAEPVPRLVGLGAATALMALNTRLLAQGQEPKWIRLGAWLTVGFGLGFWLCAGGALLQWRLTPIWGMGGALTVLGLWLLRQGCHRRTTGLAGLYAWALDFWAVGLAVLLLQGLALAGALYAVLFLIAPHGSATAAGYPWLATLIPTALILMGTVVYRSWQSPCVVRNTWLSVAGLLLALLPTLADPTWRLLSLGLAVGLLWLQTYSLKHIVAAGITVGLGLGLGAAGLARFSWGGADGLLVGAISTGLLWTLRHVLLPRTGQLPPLYARAADGWAIALCGIGLTVFITDTLDPTLLADAQIRQNPILTLATLTVIMGATAYRSWQPPRSATSLWLSLLTGLIAQMPLLAFESVRLAGLAIATAVVLVHTRFLTRLLAATVAIGLGLACIGVGLWDGGLGGAVPATWFLVVAGLLAGLWLLRQPLSGSDSPLLKQYARAADLWAIGLCSLELGSLTAHSLLISWDKTPASAPAILAAALTVGALLFRSWQRPNNWAIYGLGWGLELLTIEALSRFDQSLIALSIANIGLGILAQVLGDWLHRRTGQAMLSSWHIMPLFYGALGAVLRSGFFNSWTGFSSLGLVVIAVGVGRRQAAFKPLIYLAMIGILATAYELLFYQIQALPTGDQLLAMAALATSMVYAYRMCSPWLARYLQIDAAELATVAHLHWSLGSVLLLLAITYPIQHNQLIGLGAGVFLTRYAILQGRHQPHLPMAELWTYTGLLEALGLALYAASSFLPVWVLQSALPWLGALATIVAIPLYQAPWPSWGWPPRPWQVAAIGLPLVAVGSSLNLAHGVSLLAAAGFYEFLARQRSQPRWRYLTLVLVDGALWKGLLALHWLTPLADASLLGGSMLCISWLEPALALSSARQLRHISRLLGAGTILTAALVLYPENWLLSGSLSLIALFAGLALQIRAFLYTGTLIFVSTALYHLVILSFQYPLLKWIIGLMVGLAFIGIAASFETRRAQLKTLLRYWSTTLQAWK